MSQLKLISNKFLNVFFMKPIFYFIRHILENGNGFFFIDILYFLSNIYNKNSFEKFE